MAFKMANRWGRNNQYVYNVRLISPDQLKRGHEAFQGGEPREAMYRVSNELLNEWWADDFEGMADALTVVLLTWNQAFYRYGVFDRKSLVTWIREHISTLEKFRGRSLLSLDEGDHSDIRELFGTLLEVVSTEKGETPVGAAKALHLLAPQFFPVWDREIFRAYSCYPNRDGSRDAYLMFCILTQIQAHHLRSEGISNPETLVKKIDEYNYSRITAAWDLSKENP